MYILYVKGLERDKSIRGMILLFVVFSGEGAQTEFWPVEQCLEAASLLDRCSLAVPEFYGYANKKYFHKE